MLAAVVTGKFDELLSRSRQHDRAAFDELTRLAYDELRHLAHLQRLRWNGDQTLGTTAIVHEAYIKLAERSGEIQNLDRSHLLAVAARAMRQILVDYYRAKRAQKRGGGLDHLGLDQLDGMLGTMPPLDPGQEESILALDDSLKRLAGESERHARIIDCRYFGGLTLEETAQALGISVATVKRGAAVAHAWLARDMGALPASSGGE
jgi:RNA polymerase sigma factor (TIGR02999 family)